MCNRVILPVIFLILSITSQMSLAANRVVNLTAEYKTVNFTGTPAKAVVLNGRLPGPTLHFKEGDHVTINVYNHLDRGTAVHWHGLLVPWKMDGVAHVTQEPIPPGGVYHYQFTLKQAGTYWYHAHADLQEQQGLLGALIIDPVKKPSYHYTKDRVIVLSDWINEDPTKVYGHLKTDGDYYSPSFPLQPSLSHFLNSYEHANAKDRKELVQAYSMMQHMRMSPYDISDVAYDAFLLNGKTIKNPWRANVKVGDVVRLRLIGAGGSAQFRVKIPDEKMTVVHVMGNDVVPYQVSDLTIAPGETYDVLVKVTRRKPYVIYVESTDKVGRVAGLLATDPSQQIDLSRITPFPEPKPVMMMHDMAKMNQVDKSSMKMDDMEEMDMGEMDMSDMKDMPMSHAMPTKYDELLSPVKTNNPNKPVETINIALSGYMGRYVWFLNGVPEYRAKPILIEPGKRYRLVFKNDSMMNHPMHLHGHWMILRNGHGEYDPKVHTINVAPNTTMTADFDADAKSGYWYFHCHNLFHMKAGMANIVKYRGTKPLHSTHDDESQDFMPTAHPAKWYNGNMLDIGIDPIDQFYKMNFVMMSGYDYNKLQLNMKDAEASHGSIENADMDAFYWHLISEFWAVKGGINYFYRPAHSPYWQPGVGIEGLMPYFISTDARLYGRAGSLKLDLDLSRDTQLGDQFFLRTGIRTIAATKTVATDQIGAGLNQIQFILRPYYRLRPGLSIFVEYEHQQYYGVTNGLISEDDAASSNTVVAGLSMTF